jgi:GH25 family lysozyme M1 (1,4-beta-N-acetylmuramidase)
MTQRQALGIDINNWARIGGVNFNLAQQQIMKGTYDFLIIKAGLGLNKSVTFEEQRTGVEAKSIPYSTYFFPDANTDINQQAKFYIDLVGTDQPSYIVDVELPYAISEGGRLPTSNELSEFLDELEKLTKKQPVIYSSISVLSQIRFLSAAENYKLWIAYYPWDKSLLPHRSVQYSFFTDFLDDYANTGPSTVRGTNLAQNVILWQFSAEGKGYDYIYNTHTADPRNPEGNKFADLNVSMQERDVFMKAMFGAIPQPDMSVESNDTQPTEPKKAIEATYPGMTNQDMINLFLEAFSTDEYWKCILDAQLEYLAVPRENRDKVYTGPKIGDLPGLTNDEKGVLLSLI